MPLDDEIEFEDTLNLIEESIAMTKKKLAAIHDITVPSESRRALFALEKEYYTNDTTIIISLHTNHCDICSQVDLRDGDSAEDNLVKVLAPWIENTEKRTKLAQLLIALRQLKYQIQDMKNNPSQQASDYSIQSAFSWTWSTAVSGFSFWHDLTISHTNDSSSNDTDYTDPASFDWV